MLRPSPSRLLVWYRFFLLVPVIWNVFCDKIKTDASLFNWRWRPEIWIINLDRDTERWQSVAAELRRCRLTTHVRRFPAVDGRTLSDSEILSNTTFVARHFLTPGIIGCYLSHRALWERIAQSSAPWQIVMEDDVLLSEQFLLKMKNILRELETCTETQDYQWDVLLLGALGSVHPKGRHGFNRIASYMAGNQRTARRISKSVHVPRRPMGMHAYVLTKRGAQKLLDQASRVSGHVDVIAWGLRNLTLLSCHPMLAHQAMATPSTIGAVTRGIETKLPSVKLDNYTGITVEWAFNAPVFRLGNVVFTMGRSVSFVILGYIIAGGLYSFCPWLIWLHSLCFLCMFVLTKLTTIPSKLA